MFVPWKVYKIQPTRVAYQKPENLKFCAPFKINSISFDNFFIVSNGEMHRSLFREAKIENYQFSKRIDFYCILCQTCHVPNMLVVRDVQNIIHKIYVGWAWCTKHNSQNAKRENLFSIYYDVSARWWILMSLIKW